MGKWTPPYIIFFLFRTNINNDLIAFFNQKNLWIKKIALHLYRQYDTKQILYLTEMTTLNDLLFDVEKIENTDFATLSSCSHSIFAYPNNEKTLIQTCSERYELVPNAQIFPVIRQTIMNSGHTFSEQYDMLDHSMFMAKFVLTDVEIAIKSANDKIRPQIIIYHSYNGVRKYTIKFGFYRLVCSNGLTVPVKELEFLNLQIGGKHTISIRQSLETLMSRLDYVCKNLDHLTNGFNLLANEQVVDWSARVLEVMAQAGIKKGSENVLTSIRNESNNLYGGSVNNWLIYNGINQLIYDDKANKKIDETREQLDRKVMSILMA